MEDNKQPEESKLPTFEEYVQEKFGYTPNESLDVIDLGQEYASLCVEHERQKWSTYSKRVHNAINRLSVLEELIPLHLTERSTKFCNPEDRMDIEQFQSRVRGIKSLLISNNGK